MKDKTHHNWMITILLVASLICITTLIVIKNPYQISFDFTMDNNTLEAVKSINYSIINNEAYKTTSSELINHLQNCQVLVIDDGIRNIQVNDISCWEKNE